MSAREQGGVRIDGFRVGTNGSQDVLAAVLLGGYAMGRFEQSDRVRGSWVTPQPGLGVHLAGVELPPHYNVRTRSVFAAWLAFNHDACTWLDLNEPAITLGRKFKPVTCPVLAGLLAWIDVRYRNDDPGIGELTGVALASFVDAVEQVAPHTAPSCWYDQVQQLATVANAARATGGTLTFG